VKASAGPDGLPFGKPALNVVLVVVLVLVLDWAPFDYDYEDDDEDDELRIGRILALTDSTQGLIRGVLIS